MRCQLFGCIGNIWSCHHWSVRIGVKYLDTIRFKEADRSTSFDCEINLLWKTASYLGQEECI
jgi:hypothetical protein